MRRILIVALLLTLSLPAFAAEPFSRHQVRVGWGDMLFETMAFQPSATHQYVNPSALPEGYTYTEKSRFGYTGHIFAGYMYRFNRVVSVGVETDFEGIFWQETLYNRLHQPLGPAKASRNYNLVVLPEGRFTCLDSRWVDIYAGLGVGGVLAFDNDRNREWGMALNLNYFGIQIGSGHWRGGLELGLMAALRDSGHIYMAGSRLVSINLSYSW